MEIRRAALPQDAAGIAAIDTAVRTTNVLVASAGPQGIILRATPQTVTKRFAIDDLSAPDRPWTTGWVAVDDAQIVGFAAVGFQAWNRRLVLWHFYVDAGRRGQGLGRRLMAAVLEEAHLVDARHVWLETSNQNPLGVAAYQALGFTLSGLDLTLYDGTPSEGEFALFLSRPV
ncbi:GNAT family N-acetyltransferase [Phenylobacterium sp.]|uniref:GNAT family N-acetyltransferase n=1 Tax=Phenylobacterium sp. TaxID=1871053 RepID=UPI00271C3151|nr:GNAT family N-acetyltransferase [Phenylobacterium sp.]MDO8801098.1 GNAT family N-acetyltransferase [Phenylobacterium sp.]